MTGSQTAPGRRTGSRPPPRGGLGPPQGGPRPPPEGVKKTPILGGQKHPPQRGVPGVVRGRSGGPGGYTFSRVFNNSPSRDRKTQISASIRGKTISKKSVLKSWDFWVFSGPPESGNSRFRDPDRTRTGDTFLRPPKKVVFGPPKSGFLTPQNRGFGPPFQTPPPPDRPPVDHLPASFRKLQSNSG